MCQMGAENVSKPTSLDPEGRLSSGFDDAVRAENESWQRYHAQPPHHDAVIADLTQKLAYSEMAATAEAKRVDELTKELRELKKAWGAPKVKVKPLVWRPSQWGWNNDLIVSKVVTSTVLIDRQTDGTFAFRVFDYPDEGGNYKSIDEAKAAAQAWYEAKIRECLE